MTLAGSGLLDSPKYLAGICRQIEKSLSSVTRMHTPASTTLAVQPPFAWLVISFLMSINARPSSPGKGFAIYSQGFIWMRFGLNQYFSLHKHCQYSFEIYKPHPSRFKEVAQCLNSEAGVPPPGWGLEKGQFHDRFDSFWPMQASLHISVGGTKSRAWSVQSRQRSHCQTWLLCLASRVFSGPTMTTPRRSTDHSSKGTSCKT